MKQAQSSEPVIEPDHSSNCHKSLGSQLIFGRSAAGHNKLLKVEISEKQVLDQGIA